MEVSNLVFSCIFTIEMLLKLTAYGFVQYVSDGFNVFDGFIVCLGYSIIREVFSIIDYYYLQLHGTLQRDRLRGHGGRIRPVRPQNLQTSQDLKAGEIPAKPPETTDCDAQNYGQRGRVLRSSCSFHLHLQVGN